MLELLKKRRTIRKFKKEKIPNEMQTDLLKAALLSPSSRSINPWEFVLVNDDSTLEMLSRSKPGATFLRNAPLCIVVLADETKSDVWVEDTSISSIIIQLAAEAIGLGSCWIQIRNRKHDEHLTSEDYIKDILNIPENYKVEAIIAIGFPDEKKAPHNEKDLLFEKVHHNKFNNSYK